MLHDFSRAFYFMQNVSFGLVYLFVSFAFFMRSNLYSTNRLIKLFDSAVIIPKSSSNRLHQSFETYIKNAFPEVGRSKRKVVMAMISMTSCDTAPTKNLFNAAFKK